MLVKTAAFWIIFAAIFGIFAALKLAIGVCRRGWFTHLRLYFCPPGAPLSSKMCPARLMLRLLPLVVLLLIGCKNRQSTPAPEVSAGSRELPKDFLEFYDKFLTDSAYQIAHIQWPLAGEETTQLVDSAQAVKTPIQWQRESWDLHHPMSLKDDSYKHEWQMMGDVMVIERVREQTTGMYIERRFAKIGNDDWQLIFYSNF